MKEIKIHKFVMIKLIYGVLIAVFLISVFLPYFSKSYVFPPPPLDPIIFFPPRLYFGYIELIYGGWPGLILAVISILILKPEKKSISLIIGILGFSLILINLMIRPIMQNVDIEFGFYLSLVSGIGLVGINIFAFISREGIIYLFSDEEWKKETIMKTTPTVSKSTGKEEISWEKKEHIKTQAIDYIKKMQLKSKELSFYDIISKTGIERNTLEKLVAGMISKKEIDARERDFIIFFKEISEDKKEKELTKMRDDLQKKMSEIDNLIQSSSLEAAIIDLYHVIDVAKNFDLEEILLRAKEKIKRCEELEKEKSEQREIQNIRDDFQINMSEVNTFLEKNKINTALKRLAKMKATALQYDLEDLIEQAVEKISYIKSLESEKIKDKDGIKIKNKVEKRLSNIENLIQANKLQIALENLVEIKDLAEENELEELLESIEQKIEYCRDFQFNTINKIKTTVLNYSSKLARLELMDVSEKSGIQDQKLIKKIILEMIDNREINAEYFSKSKSVAFYQQEKDLKPISAQAEMKQLRVFLSYSTLDAKHFRIADIVKSLEKYPEIKKASYWQADSNANIVEFMEDTLKNTDVFVLFCSQNSAKSNAVKDEWQAAFQVRKKGLMKIVPVYEKEDLVPFLLMPLLNVKHEKDNFDAFIEKLYEEILR